MLGYARGESGTKCPTKPVGVTHVYIGVELNRKVGGVIQRTLAAMSEKGPDGPKAPESDPMERVLVFVGSYK